MQTNKTNKEWHFIDLSVTYILYGYMFYVFLKQKKKKKNKTSNVIIPRINDDIPIFDSIDYNWIEHKTKWNETKRQKNVQFNSDYR